MYLKIQIVSKIETQLLYIALTSVATVYIGKRKEHLVNKTNRRTEFQFYWCYDSACIGQSFCPSSGVHSRTTALVQFMQFGDRVLPGAGWKLHPAPGSTRSPNCINCTNADVRLRTPDDREKDCPKHVES
jgi:hypothetical protein